jgi:hypothetical protein
MDRMRVRLTRKLADEIDGVDLSQRDVGDVFPLPDEQARLLVAEKWAVPAGRSHHKPDRANDRAPRDTNRKDREGDRTDPERPRTDD